MTKNSRTAGAGRINMGPVLNGEGRVYYYAGAGEYEVVAHGRRARFGATHAPDAHMDHDDFARAKLVAHRLIHQIPS